MSLKSYRDYTIKMDSIKVNKKYGNTELKEVKKKDAVDEKVKKKEIKNNLDCCGCTVN